MNPLPEHPRTPNPTRGFRFRLVLALALLLPITLFALQGSPPKIPPDIQKILDKQAKGKTLTSAELQRLMDYGNDMARKLGSGKVKPDSTGGIPCDITIEGHYLSREKEGVTTRFQFSLTTQAMLFAKVNGNGDYVKSLTDPDAKVSSFLFMPEQNQGSLKTSGSGQFTKHVTGFGTRETYRADISDIGFGLQLVTTGTDRLIPTPESGEIGGRFKGTYTKTGEGPHEKRPIDGSGPVDDVAFPFPYERALNWDMSKGIPSRFFTQASYSALKNAVTAKGEQTVTLKESFDLTEFERLEQGDCTVRVTLRPSNEPRLVVRVEDYHNWLPEAGKDEKAPGNTAVITARIERRDGKPLKETEKASKITFTLKETSAEPGICMNWPDKPQSPAPPDLKFVDKENTDLKVESDGQSASTKKAGLSQQKAVLTSFDYGGSTKLEVKAETPAGPLTGHLEWDKKITSIPLPDREKDQMTARAWLKSEGIDDQKDADDVEEKPKGDGDKGDGLTNYEEYRGFMEGGKHLRSDGTTKDLMVCDTMKGEVPMHLDYLAGLTGLRIHRNFRTREFGQPVDNYEATEDWERDRIVNHNRAKGAHVVDQHGVVVKYDSRDLGYAQAMPSPSRKKKGLSTPKGTKWVMISGTYGTGPDSWADFKKGKTSLRRSRLKKVVCHEVLHTLNVYHHGQADPGFVTFGSNGNLLYFVRNSAHGSSLVMTHLFEDTDPATEILPTDPRWQTVWKDGLTVYVGNVKGQHSGQEDCVMRYYCSSIYLNSGQLYVLDISTNVLPEAFGYELCRTNTGTGVNAGDHRPRIRYGDADKGNCESQICVNDRYH